MFNRISFMLGEPYLEANLVPEIHNTTLMLDIEDSPGRAAAGREFWCGPRAKRKSKVSLPIPSRATPPGNEWCCTAIKANSGINQELLADGRPVGRVASAPVVKKPLLPDLFGAMAIHFLIHGAENLRAGQATDFSANPPVPHIDGTADPYAGFDGLKRTHLDRRCAQPALAP